MLLFYLRRFKCILKAEFSFINSLTDYCTVNIHIAKFFDFVHKGDTAQETIQEKHRITYLSITRDLSTRLRRMFSRTACGVYLAESSTPTTFPCGQKQKHVTDVFQWSPNSNQ